MSNKFLFELGTEEIPASMIDPALDQMRAAIEELLKRDEIEHDPIVMFSTPRRLAVIIDPPRGGTGTGDSRPSAPRHHRVDLLAQDDVLDRNPVPLHPTPALVRMSVER
ncbi:MAG: glycine--tRNA ligase subunit beta [Acidobacteriota bacterium]